MKYLSSSSLDRARDNDPTHGLDGIRLEISFDRELKFKGVYESFDSALISIFVGSRIPSTLRCVTLRSRVVKKKKRKEREREKGNADPACRLDRHEISVAGYFNTLEISGTRVSFLSGKLLERNHRGGSITSFSLTSRRNNRKEGYKWMDRWIEIRPDRQSKHDFVDSFGFRGRS